MVLLDLDGTLTDSAPGIMACLAYALDELGLPVPDAEGLRRLVGPPLAQGLAAAGVGADLVPDAIALYRRAFREPVLDGTPGMLNNAVYPGVPGVLAELRAAGARLAVATSKPEVFARRITDHFGLTGSFEAVCGATLSAERQAKADVIGHALDTLGVAPSAAVVMVGDREQDVLGARANGIGALGVRWGYASPGELETAGPEAIVARPSELARAVLDRMPTVR